MKKKILKIIFCKFFHHKLCSFMQNLNLECFQLSFDVHIVHLGQKWRIFKNCGTKSQKIFAVKVGYFGASLRQNYTN